MKRIYPFLALVLVLVVNFLANYLPIAGQSTGAISDAYPSLFTPAGFTFSIWGAIYLFLIGYCVYQALPMNRAKTVFDQINFLFIINCFANAAWIFSWHYEWLSLSIVLMGVILITLILIYQRIAASTIDTVLDSVLIKTPFSLYIGWITVATIANISIIQSAYHWNDVGLVQQDWTMIKLALAGAIGAAMILQQRDKVFGLVVVWASYGIYSKQMDANALVGGAAATVMVLLLVTIVIEQLQKMSADKS